MDSWCYFEALKLLRGRSCLVEVVLCDKWSGEDDPYFQLWSLLPAHYYARHFCHMRALNSAVPSLPRFTKTDGNMSQINLSSLKWFLLGYFGHNDAEVTNTENWPVSNCD